MIGAPLKYWFNCRTKVFLFGVRGPVTLGLWRHGAPRGLPREDPERRRSLNSDSRMDRDPQKR